MLLSSSLVLRSLHFSSGCSLQKEMLAGEVIGRCPSCSLFIQVIYDQVSQCAPASEICILATWPVVGMLYFKTGAAESVSTLQDEIMARYGQMSDHQDSQPPPIEVA